MAPCNPRMTYDETHRVRIRGSLFPIFEKQSAYGPNFAIVFIRFRDFQLDRVLIFQNHCSAPVGTKQPFLKSGCSFQVMGQVNMMARYGAMP